ncbi:MAG: cobalt-precorrin-5B (C(1))-methyltransferase CbiD [Lachnospiraceae bacterium]|nr:cobalt-precorrin-5B (C(1))-methyltransferase CbiD [Lachnospiraceae bacterium]
MRYGFTTGSAATAASAAAAYMLLSGRVRDSITITTPKGIDYNAEIIEISRSEKKVSCAVVKDGGDDPDITSGSLIFSTVEMEAEEGEKLEIKLDGGKGVGRVTKPGLDQPVGEAAINHVPREMIISETEKMCRMFDFDGRLKITIEVPNGEELAKHTFNPRLGIVGGISILGTTGIVEPMSMKALLDTIGVELSVKKAEGHKIAVIAPGNYGQDFMRNNYHYEIDDAVKCSNFIGDTIDMAIEKGFEGVLLLGAIGKLVKLAGGIMNTHSAYADCRMEIMTAAAIREGADIDTARRLLQAVTTEDGISILEEKGLREAVMQNLMERIMDTLKRRTKDRIGIECIVYSMVSGELAKSSGAIEYLKRGKS